MHFDQPGKANTLETLKQAHDRAQSYDIDEVVIASSTGATAIQALSLFKNFKITVVTYHCGFRESFKKVMPDEMRSELKNKGVTVVSATHALSGVERSLSKKHSGIYPVLIIADTLRLFGQGTKVAVEIAIMAADAGALSGREIVSIGGTGKGADTALILKPANQSELFNLKIREIVCKPAYF